jgi:signal transduction histidine kinase
MSSIVSLNPESTSAPIRLRRRSRSATHAPTLQLAALRAPLAVKLLGANVVVVAGLIAMWLATGGTLTARLGLAILVVLGVHLALVLVALRPIRDLDAVASRVWKGDFGARVARSAVADHDVLRVGAMFNILLDGLVADRARMRALASEVIATGDVERAALARELHDSTAQRLAALLLQLSAAARDCTDPALAARLYAARDAAQELTEEVRLLSQSLHPRVLDDLGLVPALQQLARDSTNGTGIDVDVDARREPEALPPNVASVLYRVAQEAVRNALRHASARHIRIALHRDTVNARLEIYDDGIGFDADALEREDHAPTGGLLSMRERVALVDGALEIKSAWQAGTTIVATVPVHAAS